MKLCSECGLSNQLEALVCARCGFRFARSQSTGPRFGVPLILLLLFLGGGVASVIGVKLFLERRESDLFRQRYADELRQLDETHERQLQLNREKEDQRIRALIADDRSRREDPALISGELARNNRAREWQKRLAHDPDFAVSARERALVKMRRVGSDPAVAAREALEEVARLASPPGSRIEVTNAHDQFAVRVAFKMSSVMPEESGVGTKHRTVESMRDEAREVSAYIMRELFDYCGARGISRLSLSCNHAIYRHGYIPSAATDDEKKELQKRGSVVMACLYRVTMDASQARAIPNWRAISVGRVMELMRVDYDGMTGIKLNDLSQDVPLREDPDMQLEF